MPLQNGAADSVTARRAEVARLYCQGLPQHRIGERFGVTRQQIAKDLGFIRRQWQRVMVEQFDRLRAEQLAKIDETERQAWRGWRRSVRAAKQSFARVKRGPAPGGRPPSAGRVRESESSTREEQQAGDPRFLQIVMDCVDKRLRLIGGYPDSKDKGPPVIAELILRVLGPGLSMSELCGGRVLNGRDATPEG